ncbi:MAG: glucose-6-phosphate isomerase [Acidithiobacillus sp.]|nr:MAG: glucose-6-phosphate isomerase [Acidithiobacillus sp.]
MTEADVVDIARRIHTRDVSLWPAAPEEQPIIGKRLGWLDAPDWLKKNREELTRWARDIYGQEFARVVVLGMGGSSLAARTLAGVFGKTEQGLPLVVLDTTHPEAIAVTAAAASLSETLFVSASKSGTTAEVTALTAYFYQQVKAERGRAAGENFVAITDAGSALQHYAEAHDFRRCFLNPADVGGRFSMLTAFGMVPAALLGLDLDRMFNSARAARVASEADTPDADQSALRLGQAMARSALAGRNKLTLLLSPQLGAFSAWVEQLIAESTGKSGIGIIPVIDESLPIGAYGMDRFFVAVTLTGDHTLDETLQALEAAGHEIDHHQLDDRYDLAGEFFRWEFAVAVAGALLAVNPFDEPDVVSSKQTTRRLLEGNKEEQANSIGEIRDDAGLTLRMPISLVDEDAGLSGQLLRFFQNASPTNYLTLMPFLYMTDDVQNALSELITALRAVLPLPVILNPGPRYLHSTGQLHKGGPNSGLYLIITASTDTMLPIPGEPYSFSDLNNAQASGDFLSLVALGRQVAHLDLGALTQQALAAVTAEVQLRWTESA